VRIDSGDLAAHARRVRAILNAGGLTGVKIFASGNLDEARLRDLVAGGAPIDGYGVGTRMNTCADQPYLDCAYKLQEYAGRPRRKRSEGKATWPGAKQVYRRRDALGRFTGDLITTWDDVAGGEALLQPVIKKGRRLGPSPDLATVRAHAAAELAALPEALRRLEAAPPYPVAISAPLRALTNEVDSQQH
jgi:nicotinate phosphoribosyltransferase